MTLVQKLLGVASLGLAVAHVSIASDASLLGVRYAEVGFGYLDVNHASDGVYAVGASINTPFTDNLDFSTNYSYGWAEGFRSVYANDFGFGATAYFTEGAFRPFAEAGVGYVWESDALSGDDYAVWNLGAGVEYSISNTAAVRVSGDYDDSFESSGEGSFSGTIGLSNWFTSDVAGAVNVTLLEGGDVGYDVNVIFRF